MRFFKRKVQRFVRSCSYNEQRQELVDNLLKKFQYLHNSLTTFK